MCMTNAFVVIPSEAKNGTEADKLSVKQMLNLGKVIGFRGIVKRVKEQRFIVILDKNNRKAFYADILRVTVNTSVVGSKIPRVDVSFGIVRTIEWDRATSGLNLNGQSNTRYQWLQGFHRC